MTVINVARIAPPTYVGIEVTATSLADIISLGRALREYKYRFELDCAAEFEGIGRLTVRRADFSDQHAYEGDWLKISNAHFAKDENTGLVKEWYVSSTTSVTLYGGGPAQPFNREDFAAEFAEVAAPKVPEKCLRPKVEPPVEVEVPAEIETPVEAPQGADSLLAGDALPAR